MSIIDRNAAINAESALVKANAAYHSGEEPVMIDSDYDALKINIMLAYEDNPEWRPSNSVLDVVGAPVQSGTRGAKHLRPMLSLSNAFTDEDVLNFITSTKDVLLHGELKLDGLSLALRYENGMFVRAATRGDGSMGEDVTHRLERVHGIPKMLIGDPWVDIDVLEVRGEVCMRKDAFARLNTALISEGKQPMSNPRNAAAGSLRRDDAHPETRLDFYVYQVVDEDGSVFESQTQTLASCTDAGFIAAPETKSLSCLSDVLEWYRDIEHRRADLPVDIDGVVYKVDNQEEARLLGTRSTAPRWAVAHKFPPDRVWTRITSIDLQVGRTGVLSPVARLSPVMVGGVVISNATLHNRAYIEGRSASSGAIIRGGVDIRPGDLVEVFRAGDVIPRVGSVDVSARPMDSVPYSFPQHCPSCGGEVFVDTVEVRCPHRLTCRPQRLAAFTHSFGRDALDADGVSDAALAEFIEWGWAPTLADVFELEKTHGSKSEDPLENRLGWGPVSAKRAFSAIKKARTVTADRALFSLGIPLIGKTTSRDLMSKFQTIEDVRLASIEKQASLFEIPGVGDKVVDALNLFWSDVETMTPALALISCLKISNPLYKDKDEPAGPLSGWTVVFTGSLPMGDREVAAQEARALGATVSGSISKKTTVLVAGVGGGSKRVKAESIGVPVLDGDAWVTLRDNARNGVGVSIPSV